MQSAEVGIQLAKEKAIERLKQISPLIVASKANVTFNNNRFEVLFFNQLYYVSLPDFQITDEKGQNVNTAHELIVLNYLSNADGTELSGEWLPFRYVKGGACSNFNVKTVEPLVKEYNKNPGTFDIAAKTFNALPLGFKDISYCFNLLPRVPVAVILNLATDEFPADINILFDSTVVHYLESEDISVITEMFTGKLLKIAKSF